MVLNVRRRRDQRRCRGARVWFNGREITRHCFYADGRRGVVRIYKVNAEGHHYTEPIINSPHWDVPRRAAVEELRGHVRIKAGGVRA